MNVQLPPDELPLPAEDLHERQADLLSETIGVDAQNAPKAIGALWSFIRSYDQHGHTLPLDQWLLQELGKHGHLWKDAAEIKRVSRTLIDTAERLNGNKASLQQAMGKGKSISNWLAGELEQDTRDNPSISIETRADTVREILKGANEAIGATLSGHAPSVEEPAHPTATNETWNEHSRIDIAQDITRQALLNAGLNAAAQGARILGRRAWNWFTGQENESASDALNTFFNDSLKSTSHIGAQVAVSGGVLVAARSGWLGKFFQAQSPEVIATTTWTGMERARTLHKLGAGEILADAAINAMEQTTTVAARTLAQVAEKKGAQLGASVGSALGAAFGPQAAALGGVVGGALGGMAGKAIGGLIETGGRKIVEVATKVIRRVSEAVSEGFQRAASKVSNLFSSLFS